MRNTLLRRSSIQGNKPPPPIRRTASITNTNRLLTPVGSLENLPPPPAFLLEGCSAGSPPRGNPGQGAGAVAETVKVLTELKHTPASPNSVRRMSTQSLQAQQIQQIQQLQQQFQQQQLLQQQQSPVQTPVLSSFQSPANPIYGTIRQSNTIYAQPSQLVPPGSPISVRKMSIPGNRSQSAERRIGEGIHDHIHVFMIIIILFRAWRSRIRFHCGPECQAGPISESSQLAQTLRRSGAANVCSESASTEICPAGAWPRVS